MSYPIKSKKGISLIIGYVILISFILVLGIIVYEWMRTYVPMEELVCPDGLSLFIDSYECSPNQIILNIRNNGKFNVGGYYIYATDLPSQFIATIDLSKNNTDPQSRIYPTGIKLGGTSSENSLLPNEIETDTYDLTGIGRIYSVEILPIRWQKENNRIRLASCKDAKIKEAINCAGACASETIEETCAGRECGSKANNCLREVSCGSCNETDSCDIDGQCIPPEECTDTCAGLECGTVCEINCGVNNGSCVLTNANPICSNYLCVISSCFPGYGNCDLNDSNGCETFLGTVINCGFCGDACSAGQNCINATCNSIGNGICDTGETCEQEPTACQGYQATCSSEEVCVFGACQPIAEGYGCTNYCISLRHVPWFRSSTCTRNTGQCTSGGGILGGAGGNAICAEQNPTYGVCCCFT
jgi:hypothetical protein